LLLIVVLASQYDQPSFAVDVGAGQTAADPQTVVPVPRPFIVDNDDPIYWPGGTAEPDESVILFLDEYFPEWRALNLEVVVLGPAPADGPSRGGTAVELRYSDGAVFATIPLRFSDSRWFLEEINSPAFDIELIGIKRHMEGSILSHTVGTVTIDLVYAFERQIMLTTHTSITEDQTGDPVPITAEVYHQEVHARLIAMDGDLLGIEVFSAPRQVG